MRQVIQSYRTGEIELAEVPVPSLRPGHVMVRTAASLISVGTERYMLDLARKSLVGKAMARPDLVRQVVAKVRLEGLAETYRQVMGRLDDPVPLGYSSAGVVTAVGEGVPEFAAGDRVACSGGVYASHAEVACIPRNLLVKIPHGVGFDDASFVTLGGIALHGVRMARPELGERVMVLGLGLLGLLAVQILKAAGCRVLAVDVSDARTRMALELGADVAAGAGEAAVAAREFSGGAGVDSVFIFAAAPDSNEPIELAAQVARERGKVVVPGLVGLDIPRKAFYEKELSFVVSRAWGPGIYDPRYEQKGLDYPVSFVRWTAQRNMAGFLDLIATGQVRVAPLVTHRYSIETALAAYEMILAGKEPFIGVLLTYPESAEEPATTVRLGASRGIPTARAAAPAPAERAPLPVVRVGMIGAGLFARGTLLPALKKATGTKLTGVADASGVAGRHAARKYGFEFCTSDVKELLASPETDLILVLTRHGSHAGLVAEALKAGKHVYVEKPLALDERQLSQVEEAYRQSRGELLVGFNRRFAPTTREAIGLLARIQEPLVVTMRVNAGYIPPDSWVHDPVDGGGRIIGEVCHFIDLAQALTGSLPVRVHAECISDPAGGTIEQDNVLVTLRMANGSVATIAYAAGGDKAFSRERVEVFGGGAVAEIENFRTMTWTQGGRRKRFGHAFTGVDRGHSAEIRAAIDCLRRGAPFPVRFEEYLSTTRATFAALESLRTRAPVPVPLPEPVRPATPHARDHGGE